MTFIVEIEHCVGCEHHRWNTNHDPRKYAKYLQEVNSAIRAEFPHCEVHVNPGPMWCAPCHARSMCRYPRIGAFEIAVRTDSQGTQREVHSKLATGRWPNVPLILKQVHLALSGDSPIMVEQPHVWQRDYELFEAQERAVEAPTPGSPRAVSALGMNHKVRTPRPQSQNFWSSRARSVSPNSGPGNRGTSPSRLGGEASSIAPRPASVAVGNVHKPGGVSTITAWESESNAAGASVSPQISPRGSVGSPSAMSSPRNHPSVASEKAIQESRANRKTTPENSRPPSRPQSTVPPPGVGEEKAETPKAEAVPSGPAFAALQQQVTLRHDESSEPNAQLGSPFKSTGSTLVSSMGSPTKAPEVAPSVQADPYDCEFEEDFDAPSTVPVSPPQGVSQTPGMESAEAPKEVMASANTALAPPQQSQFRDEASVNEYEDEGFETDPDDRVSPAHNLMRPGTSLDTSMGKRGYESEDDDEDLIELPMHRPETSMKGSAPSQGYEEDFQEEEVEGMSPMTPKGQNFGFPSDTGESLQEDESASPTSHQHKANEDFGAYEEEVFEDDPEGDDINANAGGGIRQGITDAESLGDYLDEFDSADEEVANIAGRPESRLFDEESLGSIDAPHGGAGGLQGRPESSLYNNDHWGENVRGLDLDDDDDELGDFGHDRPPSSIGHERPGTSMGHDRQENGMGHARPASSLQHWEDDSDDEIDNLDDDDDDDDLIGGYQYDEAANLEGFNSISSDDGDELR